MTQPENILLIDSQAPRRGTIADLLSTQYCVVQADSAAAGLQAAEPHEFLCVLVVEPAAEGSQLAWNAELGELASTIAVVASSLAEAAVTAGYYDWVDAADIQPFTLLHAVNRAVGHTQLSQTVAQQAETIQGSKLELQQFAYAISHDLQEPLRSIIGFSGLLEKEANKNLSERAQHFLNVVVTCSYRIQQMIEDLLAYSRIESRGEAFKNIPARKCFDDATLSQNKAITSSEANITCGELPAIYADHWQIVTLLEHLISNSIKFRSEELPQIHLEARPVGSDYEFIITDNGIGMEPRFKENVFKVFRRLHTREEYPGTGIGLALCKRIVQRHGGNIEIDSSPGKGAIVKFRLPASKEEG